MNSGHLQAFRAPETATLGSDAARRGQTPCIGSRERAAWGFYGSVDSAR
jgi:hypothetical protein